MNLGNTFDIYIPIIAGTILFACLAAFIVFFIRVYHKSQVKFEMERQILKNNLLQVEGEIREQTLNLVSHELHDNFGQIASLIKINLNLLSGNFSASDKAKIEESIALLKQMISDIKSLSITLNSDTLSRIGYEEALRNMLQSINKTTAIEFDLQVNQNLPSLKPETELYLYRISQEVINNTLKHSGASKATIDITYQNDTLQLVFADDGRGFDLKEIEAQTEKKKSSGLHNMAYRCNIIGAELNIKSQKGQGSEISILLKTEK